MKYVPALRAVVPFSIIDQPAVDNISTISIRPSIP
jgi:hypothetical protein